MFSDVSRWRWLTILALGNLVCWLAVAVAVGLLASEQVDLGVETLVRERQATAVAVWEQALQERSQTGSRPVAGTQAPSPTEAEAAQAKPSATSARPTASTPLPTSRSQPTPGVLWPPTPTPTSASTRATAQPEEASVSSPLLMSNPEISNLMRLNTEMGRSAPGRAVQIRYQEAALNREIAALLQNNPDLPYRDVKVDLKRGQVVVTGNITVLGFQVSTEATGTVTARDCLPQMEIQSISIAGALTPGFVKDRIREVIEEALAWYPSDYPLCLEQIVLEETGATVYGYRR